MLEAMREAIARLRGNYQASFRVCLKAPAVEATPEQVELEKNFKPSWTRRNTNATTASTRNTSTASTVTT